MVRFIKIRYENNIIKSDQIKHKVKCNYEFQMNIDESKIITWFYLHHKFITYGRKTKVHLQLK